MKRVWVTLLVAALALVGAGFQFIGFAEASAATWATVAAAGKSDTSGGDAALKQLPSWWVVKEDANGNGEAEENQLDDDDDDDYDEDKNEEENEKEDPYERMWNSVTLG
ncbi:MAG: hypothetical protein LDL33_12290 [Desulfomonile sp.]|nr:hypothetical protein [Desulfomonile sp.]